MSYRPDKWAILKIPDEDKPIYKVFGMWSGGYLDGDSWRLNSGIKHFEYSGEAIQFIGYSGSVYNCWLAGEGVTAYGSHILNDYADNIISFEQFKEEFNEQGTHRKD